MASIGFTRITVASVAIAALSASCMSKASVAPSQTTRAPPLALSTTSDMAAYPGIVSDFENIARVDGPAVVAVNASPLDTASGVKQLWPPPSVGNDPFLRFFREFSPVPGDDRGALTRQHASGFIISPDGDILTDAMP